MLKLMVFVVLVSGCAGSFEKMNHSKTIHYTNQAGLVTALALTACDWGSSAWAAGTGDYEESNPVMGGHPSNNAIATYMMSTMAITAATWYFLPENWKPVAWAPVAGVETHALYHQTSVAIPVCGIQ